MTVFLQGLAVIGCFVAANVVGAGVVLFLGVAIEPPQDEVWPWFLICTAGALAALVFIRGAIVMLGERARVQSSPSRRGG